MLVAATVRPAASQSVDHSKLDPILSAYSSPQGVDYAKFKNNRAGLDQYIARLGTISSLYWGRKISCSI